MLLELRKCRKRLKQRDNESSIRRYESVKLLFKTELNQSFNKWIEENLDSLNKTTGPLFLKKYHSVLVDRIKASLGALKNAQGRLSSAPKEKVEILKDCFLSGKHLSNENFNQQDLTTNEVIINRLLSQPPSSINEIAANKPKTSQEVGNAIMKI